MYKQSDHLQTLRIDFIPFRQDLLIELILLSIVISINKVTNIRIRTLFFISSCFFSSAFVASTTWFVSTSDSEE